MNKLIVLSAASFSHWAQAHDGHGLEGSHWHAWDALGFVAEASFDDIIAAHLKDI
jgi:hypothetical protein